MKSKESPSLYEILRTASRPSSGGGTAAQTSRPPAPTRATAVQETPKPSLKERLAAYKAAKLGEEPAPAPVRKIAGPPVPPPRPMLTPVPKPTPGAVPRASGPGERVLRLTYNTAAFLGLVGLGLLFIAYSVGVRAGRASAGAPVPAGEPAAASATPPTAEPRTPNPTPTPVTPRVAAPAPAPAPTAPQRLFSIRLIEWPGGTTEERLAAQRYAGKIKQELDRVGCPGVKLMLVRRGSKDLVALYLGEFTSRSSDEAKALLSKVRGVTVNGRKYFRGAGFEEITGR